MTAGDDTLTTAEIAELTARLRRLFTAGRDADPTERAAFLADKAALLARIEAGDKQPTARRAPDSGPAIDAPAKAEEALRPLAEPQAEAALMPDGWRQPPEMLDGIEERRTCPAGADDPAELRARLDELDHRITGRDRAGSTTGADDARAAELTHWTQLDERTEDHADGDDAGQGW